MNFQRVFCALLLTVQFGVPLMPLWGVFTLHEHIARGRVSEREWQAHREEHRNPRAHNPGSSQANIFSVPMNDGLVSVLAVSAAIAGTGREKSTVSQQIVGRVVPQDFFARTLAVPPPVPPPTT